MNFKPDEFNAQKILLPHHFYMGVIAALFGFIFVWPRYPAVGSATVLTGVLIALDDAVSHAFGVTTPLDYVWKKYLYDIFN